MKTSHNLLAAIASLCVAACLTAASGPKKEARVTRIIRDVKVLPSDSAARPASLNETVRDNSGVRTGDESRSELTFVDLTITRLGANTIFSFGRAGRDAAMETGSMLLRVPKDSGGATIRTSAVTVGITGTTVILEGNRAGRSKLMVLEGAAKLQLTKHPKESKRVLAGQMLDVKAGATTLPDPVSMDLRQAMKHPLIADFAPLPSQDLINAAIQNQQNGERVYSSQPVGSQPVSTQPSGFTPPIIIGGGMFPLPGGHGYHPPRGGGGGSRSAGSRKPGSATGSAGVSSTPVPTGSFPGKMPAKPVGRVPAGRGSATPTPGTIY
jgi:hypothetical protein